MSFARIRGLHAADEASRGCNSPVSSICSNCPNRLQCVRSGWQSPNRFWFPHVVMVRPIGECPCKQGAGADMSGAVPGPHARAPLSPGDEDGDDVTLTNAVA